MNPKLKVRTNRLQCLTLMPVQLYLADDDLQTCVSFSYTAKAKPEECDGAEVRASRESTRPLVTLLSLMMWWGSCSSGFPQV